jgi:hypothetical protein
MGPQGCGVAVEFHGDFVGGPQRDAGFAPPDNGTMTEPGLAGEFTHIRFGQNREGCCEGEARLCGHGDSVGVGFTGGGESLSHVQSGPGLGQGAPEVHGAKRRPFDAVHGSGESKPQSGYEQQPIGSSGRVPLWLLCSRYPFRRLAWCGARCPMNRWRAIGEVWLCRIRMPSWLNARLRWSVDGPVCTRHDESMRSRRGLASFGIALFVLGGVGTGSSEAAQVSGNQCKKRQVGVTSGALTCQKVGAKYVWTRSTVGASGSSCDSNYDPCVPVASDVDCAGGSGNGPAYVRGPVRVIGVDVYGVDRDGDGIGCESK